MFYISGYFERNRREYYECLNAISRENNWLKWIEFFLKAVIEQSRINAKKVEDILSLHKEMKEKIHFAINTKYSLNIMDAIFSSPIFSSKVFIQMSKTPKPTAMTILRKLAKTDILKIAEVKHGRSPAMYEFSRLLKIIER
jgi:Fic family protein